MSPVWKKNKLLFNRSKKWQLSACVSRVYLLSHCRLLLAYFIATYSFVYSFEGFCRDVYFTVFYTYYGSHVTLAGILLTKFRPPTETALSKSCSENVLTHWFMGVTLIWQSTAGKQPENDHTGNKRGQVTFTGAVMALRCLGQTNTHPKGAFQQWHIHRPFKPPTLQV